MKYNKYIPKKWPADKDYTNDPSILEGRRIAAERRAVERKLAKIKQNEDDI